MRIVADRSRCIASGQCAATQPEIFDQDIQDGRVVLLRVEVGPEEASDVQLAIELCPAQALRIEPRHESLTL